ncbi:hypothetical protein DER44DRAFT_342625 [Fusarium oxysporum]|nr:hypothetical protein DER44DRAFT_342625 [Fusarium oxysporum]
MVRPEGGQVSGNKGILNACNLDEFGEGKGSNSLLFSSSVRQALALRTRARWHRRPIGRRDAAQGSAIGLSLMVYGIECSLRHRIVLLLQESLHWMLPASPFQFETSFGPKELCMMSMTVNQALNERCLQISPPWDMLIDLNLVVCLGRLLLMMRNSFVSSNPHISADSGPKSLEGSHVCGLFPLSNRILNLECGNHWGGPFHCPRQSTILLVGPSSKGLTPEPQPLFSP